jgi:hypothetical protein
MQKLQKQRHMYDIQMMILSNPLFKNLGARDQKKLVKLVYKAEMIESYMRDREIVRINESFEDVVENVTRIINESLRDEGDEDGPQR